LREAGVKGGSAWAIIRFQQGYINWREGNYDSAYGFALEALELFKGLFEQRNFQEGSALRLTGTSRSLAGDPVNLGRTHTLLAAIVATIGKPTEALVYLDTSLALFEQYDRQREIANVSCNIGDIHLRKAEHQEAQASFRRSLHLANRVGDIPLKAVVFGNLGVLTFRSGSLLEAEEWFKKGIILAEQINDQVYISLFCAYLATVYKDQGKFTESKDSVYRALTIGRAIRNPPCISLSLVALGSLRIAQAVEHTIGHNRDQKDSGWLHTGRQDLEVADIHFLLRAKATLERVLVLQEELEAETKIEAQLALVEVILMLGDLETAKDFVTRTLEEANQYELIWGLARCQRLLGRILARQGQQEQAEYYFEQAVQVLNKCEIRLEYANTLYDYGVALMEYRSAEKNRYQQGLSYLQEAYKIFEASRATLKLLRIERDISIYKDRRG